MLVIHNSETKQKEPFKPIHEGEVRMYVCGMTVYDYCHIGHARVLVSFDVVTRWLRQSGWKVTYVRNITDIDDKIIKRANENGEDFHALTERFISAMNEDADALGVIRPDTEPKATEYVDQIISMVQTLIAKGHAYPASNGDVYYDVSSFKPYGRLSKRNLDDLQAGARVEIDEIKTDPLDFVLWKAAKPGEPSWDSPWGKGRPGWHIECSAMIEETLGLPIDIHGGGIDLVFPHHENEIAQGVCAHGCAHAENAHDHYARYWMHNGFLTVDAEKMSKSIGNVLLLHDLVQNMPGEVVRWALLSAHYRQPLDWNQGLLEQSRKNLDRLYGVLRDADAALADFDPATLDEAELELAENALDPVLDALEDDLNTPGAIAQLFGLANALRDLLNDAETDINDVAMARWSLKEAAGLLGVLSLTPDAWFEGGDPALKAEVEALLEQRAAARAAKDWPEADRIRDRLNALNVVVMDGPDGATWRVKG